MAQKTKTKAKAKKKEVVVQDKVGAAIQSLSKLSWEERQDFMSRAQELYTKESSVRGDGNEFDPGEYH